MLTASMIATSTAIITPAMAQDFIGKQQPILQSDRMTPEALWAMGRIGSSEASPDGKQIVYQVSYYSVKENKSHTMLFVQNADGKNKRQLTKDEKSESDATWIECGKKIAFIRSGEIWSMNADGSDRKQLSNTDGSVEGFKFSPDGKKVVFIKSIPYYGSIKKNPEDLPKASGRLITDMNYRHWDHYVKTISHPFIADANDENINDGIDILEGQPYECPMAPFGLLLLIVKC